MILGISYVGCAMGGTVDTPRNSYLSEIEAEDRCSVGGRSHRGTVLELTSETHTQSIQDAAELGASKAFYLGWLRSVPQSFR
jgi:hypothetical protein